MNDGDKALVIQEETIISAAERNMQGIVPLFYEMSKAEAQQVNSKNIYDSLILAYKANIGEVSNNITKIWNSDEVDLNAIKWFCMENNFQIDFAKTLFMPDRPEHVDKILSKYVKKKVPHFFIYAKDKDKSRVEKLNGSTVNSLHKLIPNKRIRFEDIAGTFDYKMLMNIKSTEVDKEIVNTYIKFDRKKDILLKQYDANSSSNVKLYVYEILKNDLLNLNENVKYIVDVLVKYLYDEKASKHKTTLWEAFGDILLKNLRKNLKDTKQCEKCGIRIEKNNSKKYCSICADVIWKEQVKENMRKYRKRKKRYKNESI